MKKPALILLAPSGTPSHPTGPRSTPMGTERFSPTRVRYEHRVALRATRLSGAITLLIVAGVHLEQYTVAHFSVILYMITVPQLEVLSDWAAVHDLVRAPQRQLVGQRALKPRPPGGVGDCLAEQRLSCRGCRRRESGLR